MSQPNRLDLRPGVKEPVVLMISRREVEQGDLASVLAQLKVFLATREGAWPFARRLPPRRDALHRRCAGGVREAGPEARQAIALEIALLGNQSLDINNPEQKYSLKALPGQFSGLHLLSIMYAAFRQIDPAMDLGMDFEAESPAAMDLKKG